jgi:hypothetical protein
MEKWKNLKIR